MSLVVSQTGPAGRVGELALWGAAGLIVLSLHFGAAVYLMQRAPDEPSDNSPPAAIMIELAAEPEAANTEEEQIAPDVVEQEQVPTEQMEPVETPPEPVEQAQPEPEPQPVEQPPEVAELPEPTPPEPVIEEPLPEPPPEPEITETIPEPLPEPIEPIEQQMTAALENVEVPLPTFRPLPPVIEKPEEKKPEPKKEPPKRVERRPKQQQPQAQQERAEAKVQAKESDRTAADRTSTGFFSQSVTPAKWKSRVEAKLARTARRCPSNGNGTALVRFSFDGSGNVTSVSLSRSSGDAKIDDYIVGAVRRASPIPAPPTGVASHLDQALTCR